MLGLYPCIHVFRAQGECIDNNAIICIETLNENRVNDRCLDL